ncbi:MAG: hypothetical protein QCI38_01370 [Candidatus Thermoplasmatota archaeon]|nr:hypothetical protein [Candidatus Thermoplasmatota archaeon]
MKREMNNYAPQPPQPSFAACPHCSTNVWDSEEQCHQCHKLIERCKKCKSPVYAGKDNCPRCGVFVAREPKLEAKAWVTGDFIARREMVYHLAARNVGNEGTQATFCIMFPEGLGEEEKKEDGLEVPQGGTLERSYQFKPAKIGDYTIEGFEIIYVRTDGAEETIVVQPVSFKVDGIPEIKAKAKAESDKAKLGEFSKVYVEIENAGTAPTGELRIQAFTPPPVRQRELKAFITSLGVGEKITGALEIVPYFSGDYSIEVRVLYQAPATQRSGPQQLEKTAGSVQLKVVD